MSASFEGVCEEVNVTGRVWDQLFSRTDLRREAYLRDNGRCGMERESRKFVKTVLATAIAGSSGRTKYGTEAGARQ